MLTCTLLTFALCADPGTAGTIAFGDLTVPIVWSRVPVRSCMEVGQQSTVDGAGYTRIETAWMSRLDIDNRSAYTGHLVVRIERARIELSAYSWAGMSPADDAALHQLYRAALWHELGHLRTAQATVDALNAQPPFTAELPSEYTARAKALGTAAEARVAADQDAYDRAAAHGIRQSALPPPFAGENTVMACPSSRGRGR